LLSSDPHKIGNKCTYLGIVGITICGLVCGVEGWADIEIIGNSKMIWLKADLGNPQGIPLEHHLGIVLHGGWMFLKEDPDCIRNDHGPENFALLCAIDLKLLKL
jgi:hypothetical protein